MKPVCSILIIIIIFYGCDKPLEPPPPQGGKSNIPIVINEFLASNGTIPDEFGEFNDWIEIYNTSDSTVTLQNVYLTDSLLFPNRWRLPDTNISAKGFLLIWADSQMHQGPLHASFRLNKSGEQIGVYEKRGDIFEIIDTLTYGSQRRDTSYARVPDGGSVWMFLPIPTPGFSNVGRLYYH